MKSLADLGIEEQLFLTQGKDKPQLFHPRVLDAHLEEYLQVKEKATTLNSTGLKTQLQPESLAEFKQLALNFEQQDTELLLAHTRKAKAEAREAVRLQRLRREAERREKEELFQHKNAKLLEKLCVEEPPKSYYDEAPIKPGFDFFDCLMRSPRREVNRLAVNVPNMMYFKEKIFHVYTAADGFLRCSDEITYFDFFRQITATRHKGTSSFDKVAILVRMRGDSYSDIRKLVLDWAMFESKVSNHDFNPMNMMQQFIRCPGGRPGVVRLHYFCFGHDNKANYAYFINSLGLNIPPISKHDELNKCVVDTSNPSVLEVFKQSGAALRPYEAEADKIVKFLNAGYNLRISEIVLDFIKDESGKIWLSGCKRIQFDESSLKGALRPKKMPWEDLSEDSGDQTAPEEKKDQFQSCGEA